MGWESAEHLLAFARTFAPDLQYYWLDVETGNAWSADTKINASVLQGMIDFLIAQGKHVGIYSTSYQYGKIVGTYAPRLPNWVPGVAHGPADGPTACNTAPSFGGGWVAMVQWT